MTDDLNPQNLNYALAMQIMLDYFSADRNCYFGITHKHLSDLSKQFGLTGKSLLPTLQALYGVVNALEWTISPKNMPTFSDLAMCTECSTLSRICFRVEAIPRFLSAEGFLYSQQFLGFCEAIREAELQPLSSVILSFDQKVGFSKDITEQVSELRETLYPLTTRIEVQHHSWKSDEALSFLRDSKMNVVLAYGPDLPGFTFEMPSYDKKSRYIRYAGENKEAWFSKDVRKRQEWLYDSFTLDSCAADLIKMIDDLEYNEIVVIMDTFPANEAIMCIRALVEKCYNS